MDDSTPTPLTDAVYWHDHDSDRIKNVALRNHAEGLERQLIVSRRECDLLRDEMSALKERILHLESSKSDGVCPSCGASVPYAMIEDWGRRMVEKDKAIAELNERLAERTRAYEEKDRKAMKLLSKSCHEHWKTSVVMLRMKALLEDIDALGRPHSRECHCQWCDEWEAVHNYLKTLSPAPSCEGGNPETPPSSPTGLTCSDVTAEGHPLDS